MVNAPANPIELFVAMPYTDLGKSAKWRKPQEVERFYEQVRKAIQKKMKRAVHLRIEKNAPKSGLVFQEMFSAIRRADVFIADLTGTNANVFLELGVRYGVSKKVTIVTTQEDRPPPFDLNQMSFIRYANGPTQVAEAAIAQIVFEELGTQKGGSPVLSLLDLEIVPRKNWEIVAGKRVEILIAESKRAVDPQVRLNYVKEAVEVDPLSEPARIEFARVLRSHSDFEAALNVTADALMLFPNSVQIHKERGLILDRITARGENRLDEAIAAYSAALQLDDKDADLHGCYAGTLRRKGLLASDAARVRYLEEALEHYRRSLALNRHSTYAGLNVLRLMMLMGASPKDGGGKICDQLKRMYHLCAFEVTDSQIKAVDAHWWCMFDLGDVLALMNERDEALGIYQKALATIPDDLRKDTVVSPIRCWKELLTAGSLEKQISTNAESIVRLLETHGNLTAE